VDDIISLIVVFIIYLVSAGSGKKKRRKNKERRRRAFEQMRRRQEEASAPPQSVQSAPQKRAQDSRKTAIQQELEARGAAQPCSDAQRIHLHEVSQQQMNAAAEGEDPCHHGEASPLLEEETDSPIYDEQTGKNRQAMAQDVLRGVIMSEILTRPSERRRIQRSGRGA